MAKLRSGIIGCLLLAGAALVSPGPAAAQKVGNVSATNPSATGRPPGVAARKLTIGASIINKELVRTKGDGTAQITFRDRTSLSIGRNSSVTIDKFVYDPQTGAGQMTTSMAKGVMRFVGGQISHSSGSTIKTPVATIGVRGATLTVLFLRDRGIIVIDHFGHINIWNDVSRQTILRPGFAVQVTSPGAVIGAPFRVPKKILAEAFALLTSEPGQHGGAVHPPTEALATRFGVGADRLPNDPAMTPGPGTIGIINTGDDFTAFRSQQQQFNNAYERPTAPILLKPPVGALR